jgi:hypothetical protein
MVKRPQPDIVEHTMAFWHERTPQPVSREDARQMLVHVVGFFQVLAEWERNASDEDKSRADGC